MLTLARQHDQVQKFPFSFTVHPGLMEIEMNFGYVPVPQKCH